MSTVLPVEPSLLRRMLPGKKVAATHTCPADAVDVGDYLIVDQEAAEAVQVTDVVPSVVDSNTQVRITLANGQQLQVSTADPLLRATVR